MSEVDRFRQPKTLVGAAFDDLDVELRQESATRGQFEGRFVNEDRVPTHWHLDPTGPDTVQLDSDVGFRDAHHLSAPVGVEGSSDATGRITDGQDGGSLPVCQAAEYLSKRITVRKQPPMTK